MTQYYASKETANNSSRNKWMLVNSEYGNKRSKRERERERSIIDPNSGGNFTGVTARWCRTDQVCGKRSDSSSAGSGKTSQ
jgi:hypothetical protein